MTNEKKSMRKIHQLRCQSIYFDAVKERRKTAEVRLNDRDFRVGDIVELVRFMGDLGPFEPSIIREITHILTSDEGPWLPSGYVMLSFGEAP
ncbi:DUF3850 domain-containing protein [Asaia spathodeae]|uniref:DUF3850 domain-containing protein n=1 Tax=Asaia spathodeae TaxID=657016 RepID=A0ABX2P928_9PROT|nr:DUF3850 domain-containing protein [Asaia spathodeae]GBR20968.1 hypothetical protein AA105894_2681 [Asaia spathodeae NBRC 105894]